MGEFEETLMASIDIIDPNVSGLIDWMISELESDKKQLARPEEEPNAKTTHEDTMLRRTTLRVRNANTTVTEKNENREEKPGGGKRKLSEVLGHLQTGANKKRGGQSNENSEKPSNKTNATAAPKTTKRKLDDEDKENVPPRRRTVASKSIGKAPHLIQDENNETAEESNRESPVQSEERSLEHNESEVAKFLAERAALRKINQNVTISQGQLVSTTSVVTTNTASLDSSLMELPLPEFTTVSSSISLDHQQKDDILNSIMSSVNGLNSNEHNNNNNIQINVLASEKPIVMGQEYEVVNEHHGVTICRAIVNTDSNKVNVSSPHAVENDETQQSPIISQHDEQSNAKSSKPAMDYNLSVPEDYVPEKLEFNGIDLTSIEGKNLNTYAFNVARALFTLDELEIGYIPDGDTTRLTQKKKLPLDQTRVQVLKDAICRRFNIDEIGLSMIWKKARTCLHLRFGKLRQMKKKNSSTENV